MGFFKDRSTEITAAVDSGDTERAADLVVHSMLEGPGSLSGNLAQLTEAVEADKKK